MGDLPIPADDWKRHGVQDAALQRTLAMKPKDRGRVLTNMDLSMRCGLNWKMESMYIDEATKKVVIMEIKEEGEVVYNNTRIMDMNVFAHFYNYAYAPKEIPPAKRPRYYEVPTLNQLLGGYIWRNFRAVPGEEDRGITRTSGLIREMEATVNWENDRHLEWHLENQRYFIWLVEPLLNTPFHMFDKEKYGMVKLKMDADLDRTHYYNWNLVMDAFYEAEQQGFYIKVFGFIYWKLARYMMAEPAGLVYKEGLEQQWAPDEDHAMQASLRYEKKIKNKKKRK